MMMMIKLNKNGLQNQIQVSLNKVNFYFFYTHIYYLFINILFLN